MKAFQIKVSIQGAKPPVWRRISIPASCTFKQLHESIQILFCWMDCHLYNFRIPSIDVTIIDTECVDIDPLVSSMILDVKTITLDDYFKEGLRLTYTYDVGDDWKHSILVEKEIDQEKDHPILLKWKGENFAEDAGNVEGYDEICKIASTSDHPDHKAMKQWLHTNHHDFFPDEVRMYLQKINVFTYATTLTEPYITDLNAAMMMLKKTLLEKHFDDVMTLTIEKNDQRKMVGIIETEGTYSLQLYDDEKQYYHGIEFANSNSLFNIYANCILLLISNQPLPFTNGWCSEDECCVVKSLKTGYLPSDIDNDNVPDLVEYIYMILWKYSQIQIKFLTNRNFSVYVPIIKIRVGTYKSKLYQQR